MRYTINGPGVVKKSPTLWVVDDFYSDPDAIREYALTLDYHFSDYHRGRRTEHQFEIPGTKEAFESIMGMKITNWMETYGMCGRFQHCTCEDALVYHADMQRWAATVYLTPDAPYECGTSLLAHKETGIRHVDTEGSDVIWKNKLERYIRYYFDNFCHLNFLIVCCDAVITWLWRNPQRIPYI